MKHKKFYTVYKTTNILNGKYYIGIHETNDLEDDYLGSGKHLKHAINKYGSENFTREWLFLFDNKQDQLDKEKELVTVEFCKRKDTYNICEGGFGGGWNYANRNKLNIHNKEVYIKAGKLGAKAFIKRFNNDSILRLRYEKIGKNIPRVTNGFKDKKHSEETKQKMRKSKNVGKHNSQYGTCWITNGQENKKIPKDDLDKWIELGYYKGRIVNHIEKFA